MNKISTILFLLTSINSFSQNMCEAEVITIAKNDSILRIEKNISAVFHVDSITSKFYWIVKENIDFKDEISSIKMGGKTFIYNNQLIIDDESKTVVKREKIEVGSVHINPSF